MKSPTLVIVGLTLFIIVLLGLNAAFDAGKKSVVMSCDHTSFFKQGDKTYECLPYDKSIWEKSNAAN